MMLLVPLTQSMVPCAVIYPKMGSQHTGMELRVSIYLGQK